MSDARGSAASQYGLPESPPCPFCSGVETELHSPFGPQLSVSTYWCRHCHTAFEWLKWKAHRDSEPSSH